MRKKALDDQQYLTDLLTEVQRLYPPLYGGRRYACQVNGHRIPQLLYLIVGAQLENVLPNSEATHF